uniref:Peptidase S1 domain-containing protein n=1 Tax=Strigamia maritima TaxID=126957 RepID=T1IV59_STRMM
CGFPNLIENGTKLEPSVLTNSRIVGGETAVPNMYPWMVAIIIHPGVLTCGGSLISDRYVLTASHCFLRYTIPVQTRQARLFSVALASHDLSKTTTDKDAQLINVERVILHANFDQETSLHDIALLRLSKSVIFNNKIHPICLPTAYMEIENKVVTAIGWGKTTNDGSYSNQLQEVKLRVENNSLCQANYVNTITSEMICAGNGNKDSCQGDSGGPLMLEKGEIYIQVGVVSFGLDCGIYGVPGVYTRIDQYLDFISKHALQSDHCVPLKGLQKIEKQQELSLNQTKNLRS